MKQPFYLISLFLLVFTSACLAQTTYVVSSNADSGPNTLRAAITSINTGTASQPYSISFTTAGPVSLTAALPSLIQSCTLIGATPLNVNTGQGGTTIERSYATGIANFRLLTLATSNTQFDFINLTLTNGNSDFGGAIFVYYATGISLNITNCLITGNQAYGGGAIYAGFSSTRLTHSRITNNTAEEAGGLIFQEATATITNCQISNNISLNGSALRIDANALPSSVLVMNTLISGNTTTANDAAIRLYSPSALASLTLINSTITNNHATQPNRQGVVWLNTTNGPNVSLIMYNSIIYGNSVNGSLADIDGTVNVLSSNNLVGTGGGLTDGLNGNLVGLDKNPYFRNISGNDFRLSGCSPAINRGTNSVATSVDLDDMPRLVDGTIDLGAYEYVGNYQTPNAGPITVSGPASSGNPARLTATATGQTFIFTGPNGYVFSNVYRTPGSYSLFAPNVQTPGLYTLTVYGASGCPPASSTVTVY